MKRNLLVVVFSVLCILASNCAFAGSGARVNPALDTTDYSRKAPKSSSSVDHETKPAPQPTAAPSETRIYKAYIGRPVSESSTTADLSKNSKKTWAGGSK